MGDNLLEILKEAYKKFSLPNYIIKEEKNNEGVDGHVVSYVDRNSYVAEQFKILRTNLYSLSPEKPLQTIAITSSQLEEGKTLIVSNIAATLAQDTEKKTLLVDADLRKPKVHSLFGLAQKPGLEDILQGNATLELFLRKPAIGNLYIIPSGTTAINPSDILSPTKIKALLEQLKAKFDFIILDTPPALNVSDAGIIGALCDAVFLVVRSGVTPKNIVEEGFNALKDAHAKPKACILNDVLFTPLNYYQTKYKKYY